MTMRLAVSACSDVGLVRQNNEDAYLVADLVSGAPAFDDGIARFEVGPRGALVAVSDGMGGHAAGEVASAMTLSQLEQALATRTSTADPDLRIIHATEAANAEVYKAGRRPSCANMGATVTAVLVDGAIAHVAQVGDSRAYLIRDGKIQRLTEDQSLANYAMRSGAISAEEARESPLRHVLLQAVGQAPDLHVAMRDVELRQKDCLVLCSDGLTNEMKDEEICSVVLSSGSLAAGCQALVDQANERGGHDNVTVVLVGVSAT